ncbi:carbohydrate kinase family protein [Conexibacter sp. JD483]|uniref:carbohydrate kinase family protein n=1 Tax=unclassified Conexibacter TaxID=2627773 RepID=UPI00272332B0|nr:MULTISPECIES: carbohydrate kinase family protein [unclassified Conexibacter]MDO8184294.1 carbohydrate kinase family protein [Conexibacter sp. CPCC 205706]MDO8197600.1 carbohydrate kinase family protein [Conexibacter sp. CPCC 205762]MDR9369593.1 carbohydrate kinase family protein [Conexibacter sp. JD483]
MSVELVCGDPAFLDLTFAGLDGLPGPGEERHADDLLRTPGGGATVAIGAARLGLKTALATPLGADAEGDLLRAALRAEGVAFSERTVERTPVTAVLPWGGERAMATFQPDEPLEPADIAAFAPQAVVLGGTRLRCAPPGVPLYVTLGDADARALAPKAASGDLPAALTSARALIVNAREASLLAGASNPVVAARTLARSIPRVVVTLGADGALAVEGETLITADGVAVEAVDTTGAGDLFTATYIWSELRGADPAQRLQWACLAAALSVRVPTAVAGAQTFPTLARAGTKRGLALPPDASTEILGGSQ